MIQTPIIIAYDATHIRECVSSINATNPTVDKIDIVTRELYRQIHLIRQQQEVTTHSGSTNRRIGTEDSVKAHKGA